MKFGTGVLVKLGILNDDLDDHFVRASMVIIYVFFVLSEMVQLRGTGPDSSHINHGGPLIFWFCPVFGIRGATWFLGVAEWTFGLH